MHKDAETQTMGLTLICNAQIITDTQAIAAVPTEGGCRDKCVLKARLKGSLKEERL